MADSMKALRDDLDALAGRVAELEGGTGAGVRLDVAHQVASDRALVARFVNTREDAVAQEAARERLRASGHLDEDGNLADPADDEDPAGFIDPGAAE